MTLLFLDFASKGYVYHVLSLKGAYTGMPVFYDFAGIDFVISLAVNKGAAWGFFSNYQIVLLCVRIAVIFGLLLYLFFINQTFFTAIPLVFIVAGAIGNVVDFFLYGFVIDFLQFNLWGYHFPVFNFADSCITIGVAWLLLTRSKSFYAKQER